MTYAPDTVADRRAAEALIVDVDGFEGPLDLLLSLSRSQKVDLRRISVQQLAEQYLDFIARAQALRIELAADYLVMAAWLAFLKSRLLLPPDPQDSAPTGDDLAAHLAWQLERLQAMRDAAARLMDRPRLGQDIFARGAPDAVTETRTTRHDATLLDLMRAYARLRTRDEFRPYAFDRRDVFSLDAALDRLGRVLPDMPGWATLDACLPADWCAGSQPRARSATASTFAAALELARQGRAELAQSDSSAPLRLRDRPA